MVLAIHLDTNQSVIQQMKYLYIYPRIKSQYPVPNNKTILLDFKKDIN